MRFIAPLALSFVLLTFAPQVHALPAATQEIVTHLEKLGYQHRQGTEEEEHLIHVTHPTQTPFIFFNGAAGISFAAHLPLKADALKKRAEILEAINLSMIDDIWMIQLFIKENEKGEPILRMQGWMPDAYTAEGFASFMKLWQEDIANTTLNLKPFLK